MKRFLRENWLWLALPIVVLVFVLLALFWGGGAQPEFDYPL